MKSAFFKTLAVTALAVAAAVPAAAQFDVLFDIGAASGAAAAAPSLTAGAGQSVPVRIYAVKTVANNRRVGDLQIRLFYNTSQINDAVAPVVSVPGLHTAYAAVVSTASTADGSNLDGNAETNRYRTLLVSYNPTNAPLDFGAGAIGDQVNMVTVTFQTAAGFDPAVDSLSFGTTPDPAFPSGYRNSTPTPGPVYATNAVTADTTTFVSYNIATDADGDGRLDSAEDEFPAAPQTSNYMWDTDSDGIADGRELLALADGGTGTDPNNEDTDGDGIIDWAELRLRAAGLTDNGALLYSATVVNTYTDADSDGLPDVAGVDPGVGTNFDDAGGTDAASDAFEYASGTNAASDASVAQVGDLDVDGLVTFADVFAMYDYVTAATTLSATPNPRNGNLTPGSFADPVISFTDVFAAFDYVSAASPAAR